MKISLAWLKQYVAIPLSAEKLAHRLTLAGLEVEKVETVDGDTVMEMEITPNRADCLSLIGVAREISAVLNKPLLIPKIKKIAFPKTRANIEIQDREGCRRYFGTVIQNVKIGPSPEWLQQRLLSLGLRPINNVVDITNFVLMETGQPLHAFDYDRLSEKRIVVRRANSGEKLRTLDGVERTLDPSILVIADATNAVALAGIMGGENSEVSNSTKNILLESAYFNPIVIRRGGRKLAISTDASYRFERGVDLGNVAGAAARAISLILEIAGGNIIASQDVLASKTKEMPKKISVSCAGIEKQLGAKVSAGRVKTILQKLGFTVVTKTKDVLVVTAPSFRPDVKRLEDVVEEVARVVGYDVLPTSLPNVTVSQLPENPQRKLKEKIRQLVTGLGFSEIITYTLCNQAVLEKTGLGDLKSARIQNPLNQDQEIMRPALLPSFLAVAQLNLNRGQRDLRFFEIGKVYLPSGEEKEQVAFLLTGQASADWRVSPKRNANFYDLLGPVETLLARVAGVAAEKVSLTSNLFVAGEAAKIFVGPTPVGVVGSVSKEILRAWDVKHVEVFYAELDLNYFLEQKTAVKAFSAIPTFPAVSRDVSLAVTSETTFAAIQSVVKSAAGELLSEIRFQELYLGEKLSAGQRGYIFSVIYQSNTHTLTEEEITSAHENVCRALVEKLGVVIR